MYQYIILINYVNKKINTTTVFAKAGIHLSKLA
jgi:hypothetical protein